MSEKRVAIVAGARTPFVRAGKAFASLGPLALARLPRRLGAALIGSAYNEPPITSEWAVGVFR